MGTAKTNGSKNEFDSFSNSTVPETVAEIPKFVIPTTMVSLPRN